MSESTNQDKSVKDIVLETMQVLDRVQFVLTLAQKTPEVPLSPGEYDKVIRAIATAESMLIPLTGMSTDEVIAELTPALDEAVNDAFKHVASHLNKPRAQVIDLNDTKAVEQFFRDLGFANPFA